MPPPANPLGEIAVQNIVEFTEFETNLVAYKSQYLDVIYDLAAPGQLKQARADSYAIGKTIAALDARHKAVKQPLQEKVALLDGERKRIKDGLRGIQASIKGQVETHEAAIIEADRALQARAAAVSGLLDFDSLPTIATTREKLAAAQAWPVDDTLGDHEADAALNKLRAIESLQKRLADLEEVAARNLAREQSEARDRKAREARIAAEAAEAAKKEQLANIEREHKAHLRTQAAARNAKRLAAQAAEKAERDKVAAAEKAERDKVAAVKQAKAEAAREAAQQAAEFAASVKESEALIREREADDEHRDTVEAEAATGFVQCVGLDRGHAERVVAAIRAERIPGVFLVYLGGGALGWKHGRTTR
jgi:colicin import membrane protein